MLSACSNRFTYNQLDWLIPWYIDDYIEFNAEQSAQFEQKLDKVLLWHRTEELETIINLLNQIEPGLDTPLTARQVGQWISEVRESINRVEKKLYVALIEMGDSLTEEQLKSLFDNLADKQIELKDKYLTRSQQQYAEDSAERLIESLEKYLGQLEINQKNILIQTSGNLQRFDEQWLLERDKWFAQLEEFLHRQPGWKQELFRVHTQRIEYRPDEYQYVMQHNLGQISLAIAKVLNQRTPEQQKKLQSELAILRSDLQSIKNNRG